MHSEGTLVELVGQVYDAAADPKQWVRFLETLERVLLCPWGAFYVHDFNRSRVEINAATGFDPAYLRSYEQYYVSKNVFLTYGKERLRSGTVSSTVMFCPDHVLYRSEFYNDWLAPQRMLHGVNATVLRTESLVALFAAIREEGAKPVDRDDVALVRALMPHLQRAVNLHSQLADLRARERAARDALDRWSVGVILLDRNSRVLLMNSTAETIATQREGLMIGHDGLHTARAIETARLKALIRSAVVDAPGPDSLSVGAMAVSRAGPKRPLVLLIAPLRSPQAVVGESRAACMVFVSDPDASAEPHEDVLRRLYGLTPAESKFASLLVQGRDVKRAAQELKIRMNTARTHLKRVFAKTDTKRQAELVSLLLRVPASSCIK